MKKKVLLISAILLALFLAACGDGEDKATESESVEDNINLDQQEPEKVQITDEEVLEDDADVVSIDGNAVQGNKYNNIYRQLKTMYQMYGQAVSDVDALQQETIDILTEQELIRQDAVDIGIEVTEEEAQEEMDTITEVNGEEALEAMLTEYEMTEEQFLEQLMDDLLTIRYIESEFEIEVTDEEIEEQYSLLQEEQEDVGELGEYEESIRQALMEEKQNEMLDKRIEELKEEAEIEVLI